MSNTQASAALLGGVLAVVILIVVPLVYLYVEDYIKTRKDRK